MRAGRVIALALALGAIVAAPAAAAPGLVFDVNGEKRTVGADQIAAGADVPPTTYVVGGQPRQLTGLSLRRAVGLAGADPDSITAVTIEGVLQFLTSDPSDLADPPPFPEGPALVWVDEQQRTNVLRPAKDGKPAELQTSAPGEPLQATLDGVTLLEVGIIAPKRRVKVGERVQLFTTSTADDGATYTWDFDDGTSGTGEDVVHRFQQPGRYRVTVTVSDGAGGGGTSAPVTIVVGDDGNEPEKRKDEREKPRGGSGGSGGGGGGGGSAATGVGGTGAAGAPATPDPGAFGADDGLAPEAAEPAPEAVEPASEPEPERRTRRRHRDRDDEPAPADPVPPGAVEGVLLADASGPESPAVRAAVAAAGRTPVDDPDRDGGIDVPPGGWVGLGALLVFSAGALTELRALRRRR
jgi:hypothetical protein